MTYAFTRYSLSIGRNLERIMFPKSEGVDMGEEEKTASPRKEGRSMVTGLLNMN